MSIKNSIPNFVTCCSLISGCIACIMALRGNLPMATLWIVIAAVFDFGDGFAARSTLSLVVHSLHFRESVAL